MSNIDQSETRRAIRAEIERRGWSVYRLARACRDAGVCHVKTVERYMRGETSSPQTGAAIAGALGVEKKI